MWMDASSALRHELRQLLAELGEISERTNDARAMEPTLLRLRERLEASGSLRPVAEEVVLELLDDWPFGAVEALEFPMRTLQWESIRLAMVRTADGAADFRDRDLARRVLEVYEDVWPGGDIYETYDYAPKATRTRRAGRMLARLRRQP